MRIARIARVVAASFGAWLVLTVSPILAAQGSARVSSPVSEPRSSRSVEDSVDVWTIDSGPIDPDNYFGETIANGMIGMRTLPLPFRTEQTLIYGAYETLRPGYVTALVSGFDFLNLVFSIDGERIERLDQVERFRQRLQMKQAAFVTTFDVQDKASVTYTLRALRHLPHTALLEVAVTAKRPITIAPLALIDAPKPSASIDQRDPPMPLTEIQAHKQSLHLLREPLVELHLRAASAKSQFGRHTVAAAHGFIFDEPPTAAPVVASDGGGLEFTKEISAGKTYRFALVGSILTTAHVSDPLSEAQRATTFAIIQGTRDLIARHESAWADLWKGDILIEGDDDVQRKVHGVLFHLYSSARAGTDFSIPPFGLSRSTNGYLGHIFVDADLGMLPGLAALHPDLARTILEYRVQRLDAARHKAATFGYDGALFPWESAANGEEETPAGAMGGALAHLVTASVGISAWHYFRITQDTAWLREKGYRLIEETADFWASRVTRAGPGRYDINHIIGGDEAVVDVENAAHVNGAAIVNLRAATSAAKVLGVTPNPDWDEVQRNVPILKEPDGVILQHASYHGESVPQADANFLVWPLQLLTEPIEIRRNLEYYSTRSDGISVPTIALPVLAIIHQRLGEQDKAYALLKEILETSSLPPFGVIPEYPADKNPYFVTGAGGLVQTLLFGFGGLDITDRGLIHQPGRLPAAWKSLTITGVGPERRTFVVDGDVR